MIGMEWLEHKDVYMLKGERLLKVVEEPPDDDHSALSTRGDVSVRAWWMQWHWPPLWWLRLFNKETNA